MIVLTNIIKRFPVFDDLQSDEQIRGGFFYALDDVSLSLNEGGCTIIAGANGSGKSLLMSIIAGLEEPTFGSVKTNEKIGLVFQEPDLQILGETPREDIAFGPRNMKLKKNEIASRVKNALLETGLEEKADFPARSLSGGEKRRLASGAVLAMDAGTIIFDEPYANLDFPGILQVNSLFQKLLGDKKNIIILTHELEKCLALANRFIILYKGKITFDGLPMDALSLNLASLGIHHPLLKPPGELKDLLWL